MNRKSVRLERRAAENRVRGTREERGLNFMTKQELKDLACGIIDGNRDRITALGDSVFAEPETGWKEFKTAEKIKKVFESLGYPTADKQCITGVIAQVRGKEKKLKISVMGELDALGVPDSPFADPKTGAAHMCGHHCMIAALSGVAYALHDRRVMDELSGDVALMAVPAEEFIEMGYRGRLRREGKIKMFGGKQEFIYRGLMDDVDMMVMQHTTPTEGEQETPIKANVGGTSNGFVSKEVFTPARRPTPAVRPTTASTRSTRPRSVSSPSTRSAKRSATRTISASIPSSPRAAIPSTSCRRTCASKRMCAAPPSRRSWTPRGRSTAR